MESILNAFLTANETSYRSWGERYPDRQAMGYICTYTPEEMIHAAGFTPVRLCTGLELPTQAEAHLQNFTCAPCRSVFHQALRGDLAFLSGLVFPHTCDTLQVLADIWRENFPELEAHTVTAVCINQSLQMRAETIVDLVRRFDVDGVVFHSNRSCKPYSLGQYDIRSIVTERTGVPGLLIEADMCDTRAYTEGPIKTRIQAFMETLAR